MSAEDNTVETASATVVEVSTTCSECKLHNDHSWWCGVGADEVRAGSRRYFWRD